MENKKLDWIIVGGGAAGISIGEMLSRLGFEILIIEKNSKLAGETTLNKLASNWCIARTSTPFGIHPIKKSFPLWVKENLESKKKFPVVTDQFTSPTYVPNFSKINELPKKSVIKTNNIETSFFSEKIFVRELDYYYTNSISRSSKTMSECRQIRQKIKKDGTNN